MKRHLIVATLLAAGAAGAWAAGAWAAGASVAFVSLRSGDPQLYVRDGDGRTQPITRGRDLPAQPAWGPEDRLAFVVRVGSGTRIVVAAADGSGARRLTTEERIELAPVWSPDGRSIAHYSRAVSGGPIELRVADVDSGRSTTLATNPADMGPQPPSWSADGKRLAFSAREDNRPHGWVVDVAGGTPRNLTKPTGARAAHWPQLSPDGRRLLWIADRRERLPVVVTDVETGESAELTREQKTANESARWSPDGRSIVFASTRDSVGLPQNDIFVMDADGANVRNLSRHPGEDFDPRWSGDGRSIVFASLRSGTSLLYEVPLAGGPARPLAEHASHDMDHALRPRAAAH